VDRLAELLNEFAQTGCHWVPPEAAACAEGCAGCNARFH
jgi:hypothetical protein